MAAELLVVEPNAAGVEAFAERSDEVLGSDDLLALLVLREAHRREAVLGAQR